MENEPGKRLAADPNKGKKTALLILAGVAAVLLVFYLVLCALAGSDKLMPHSTALGVDLSGMTRSQAEEAVTDRLVELTANRRLELYEPDSGATVELDATGLVAQATLETGVGGQPFLTRGASYLSHLLGREDQVPIGFYFSQEGEDKVTAAVEEIGRQAEVSGVPTTYREVEDALVFTKGVTGTAVDRAALREALRSALLGQEDRVTLTLAETPPEEPDFEAIREKLYAVASEAYFDPEAKEIVPSVTGKDFDIEAARIALAAAGDGTACRVPLQLDVPEMTTEKLTGLLFRDVLGEATTKVTGSSIRKGNVANAASLFTDTILMPGEEFSYNKLCTPFSTDNGYGKAPGYVGGKSIDVVAGGVCQGSSTIYWAALKANMEIVERYAHSYEPSYVRGGLDATVYGDYGKDGSLDFRFKNNTDHPIKIEGYVDSKNYLHVTILGTNDAGIHAEPYSTNRVVTKTYETLYEANAAVPQGTIQKDPERTGYNAVTIDTYQKLVDAEGNVVSEEFLYQTKYRVRNEVMLYNPEDAAAWGIDPATGVRTEPVVGPVETPAPGVETPLPTEPGGETVLPPEGGGVVLPPEGGEALLPPEGTQPPVETPPPTEPVTPPPSQESTPAPGGDLFQPPQV